MDDCFIGNEGLVYISDAILCCKSLRVLSIAQNNITAIGIQGFSTAIVHNMALKELRLLHNPLGPKGEIYSRNVGTKLMLDIYKSI